jgi:glyoxylase-like metal-dependent hydrolase (beta-lactamase superfamily II)
MILETLVVSPFGTNCFLVGCPETKEALVVDPGDDAEEILGRAEELGLSVKAIVLTHGHVDHVCAAPAVKEATGAEILLHADDVPLLEHGREMAAMFGWFVSRSPTADRTIAEGDEVKAGTLSFRVLHTPGHSPGGICLVGDSCAFVGDLIFAGSIGRCDLPGGSERVLLKAVREKIFTLPDETVLYPGHGPETTVGEEKASNPFFREGGILY